MAGGWRTGFFVSFYQSENCFETAAREGRLRKNGFQDQFVGFVILGFLEVLFLDRLNRMRIWQICDLRAALIGVGDGQGG
jgi:hypothetical protein